MTFTQFLRIKEAENSAVADFARDWLGAGADPPKPRVGKTFGPLRRYLESAGACPAAIEAGQQAFELHRVLNLDL